MAAKNPKLVINAFKGHCFSKFERIETFFAKQESTSLNSEEVEELIEMNMAPKDQFSRMVRRWEDIMGDIDNIVLCAQLDKFLTETRLAVDEGLMAFIMFIKANPVREDVSEDFGEDNGEDVGEDAGEDTGEDPSEYTSEDVSEEVCSPREVPGRENRTRQEVPGNDIQTRREIPESDICTSSEVPGSDIRPRWEVPRSDTSPLQKRQQSSPEATETLVLCRRDNSHHPKQNRHPSSARETTVIAQSILSWSLKTIVRSVKERNPSLSLKTIVRSVKEGHLLLSSKMIGEVCKGATPVMILEDIHEVFEGGTPVVVLENDLEACEGVRPLKVHEGTTPVLDLDYFGDLLRPKFQPLQPQ